jgi:4-amino-4-deoxy-L-arabinose transferase-like glycosyltransferase
MGLGGWVAAKAGVAVLGGAVAALLAWTMITRLGVSVKTAVLTSAVFALSPPLAIYSTQVYPELPAALALLAGFGAVVGPFDR